MIRKLLDYFELGIENEPQGYLVLNICDALEFISIISMVPLREYANKS